MVRKSISKNNEVIYPVVLSKESNDVFVKIPDIQGGYTQGENDIDAIKMAKDAISNLLEDIPPEDYPLPSKPLNIKVNDNEKLVYVSVNMDKF